MPVWICLGATLWLNYDRSTKNKSTLCSYGRRHVRPAGMVLAWTALSSWLLPHYAAPFFSEERDLSIKLKGVK